MPGSPKPASASLTIAEPFHGMVWLSASRASSAPVVNLVVSIERSWDVDIMIDLSDAVALAESIGGANLCVTTGRTVDGAAAVLATQGDRLAITVLDDRISDVLLLGNEASAIRERLRAAAGERP
jgi:hypothetical protein